MKLVLSIIFALSIFAGNERGNGGQSIYVGNNAFLRDIVEVNNCMWHSPELVRQRYPKITDVLASIGSVHWLTKLKMEEEFTKLNFCFTQKRLPPLSYNNTDDLYIFTNQLFDQPAVNDGGIIFIDIKLFNDMDEVQQAFLFLHEVAHELFDKKEERQFREPRLRQFIMNTYHHYQNPVDTATFTINVQMTKFKYLRSDISKLNESEIKAIYFNTATSKEVITNLFFKYRRFVESQRATNDNRRNLEAADEEIYLANFTTNLKSYREIARSYVIELLKDKDIKKLNNLNLPELYNYFKNDFINETTLMLQEEIEASDISDYKSFFQNIGDERIKKSLVASLVSDFKQVFVSNETRALITNSQNLLSENQTKAIVLEVYNELFTSNYIDLNFVKNFLSEISYEDITKNLTVRFLVKLHSQFNSFSFTNGILSNEELAQTIISAFEVILLDKTTSIHASTLELFLKLGKVEELKNIIKKYQGYYVQLPLRLNEIFQINQDLISFSTLTNVELFSYAAEVMQLVLGFKSYKVDYDLEQVFGNYLTYTYTTKYSRGLFGSGNVIDSYSLKDITFPTKLGMYLKFFNKAQKKDLKKQVSSFLNDWKLGNDNYKSETKFSQFKSQLKQEIFSML